MPWKFCKAFWAESGLSRQKMCQMFCLRFPDDSHKV